jgi:hypothetical protein
MIHAVTEIESLRGAIIMQSGSTNNKINIEDDDDDDDNDNLSAHTYAHIYNKHYFQCHKIVQIVITIGTYHFWQLRTKFCPTSCSQG